MRGDFPFVRSITRSWSRLLHTLETVACVTLPPRVLISSMTSRDGIVLGLEEKDAGDDGAVLAVDVLDDAGASELVGAPVRDTKISPGTTIRALPERSIPLTCCFLKEA